MTLFSIAVRNIKRNFYDYLLYFLSMVFSIVIYFTFVSIKYNEQVLQLGEVRQRVAAGFTASSIVLAIFALIFIWYSNSFFTRKRKKEIGLYSLLGIKKRQIGRLLFYENIILGVFALLVGIFFGSLLSKVFVMLLVRLMGFSVPISISIIPEAIFSTLKTFAVLFLLTSMHGYLIIYRFKLVELFKAEKTGEKKPGASVFKAFLSILFIFGGYYFYLTSKVNFLYLLLITLISVVIGTFLLFSSLSIFMIKLARKNKKRYYKGINMVGVSNLLYRIKGHARTLALIAVLSATTLTAMSVTASLYYDFKTKLDFTAPFSYVYMTDEQNVYNKLNKEIGKVIQKYPEHRLMESIEYKVLRINTEIPIGISGEYSTQYAYLMSESSYNKIAGVRGLKKITLVKSNDISFIDEYYNELFRESYDGKVINIQGKSGIKSFIVTDFAQIPILNIGLLRRTLVIRDEVFDNLMNSGETLIRGRALTVSNERESKDLTEGLANLIAKNRSEDKSWSIWFNSFYRYYQSGIVSSGQSIFIGAFLGLVFLISTGSIIFFKLLSEASEERLRYEILRKIGVSKKEIKSLISRQILLIFASPLLLGILHSLVAVTILEKLLSVNLTVPISLTIIVYTIIYMVYYFVTVNSYIKTIDLK